MANFLAPIINEQQEDANGAPLSGGTIEVYLAGSSTQATTYSDQEGDANMWPIVLNTLGVNNQGAVWLTGGAAYKFVIKSSTGVVQRTIDNISGVNDTTVSIDQWIVYQGTPTYISATSFTVPGDQTPIFQVHRRIRTANTGGMIYSSITASAYSAPNTTVTVSNDSGVLDAGLSQVAYGVISADNTSEPLFSRVIRSTAAGSAVIPARVTTVYLSACAAGGGGGGGGGGGASNFVGGGGGGGAAGKALVREPYSVTPGSTVAWTMPTGGLHGNGSVAAGASGAAGGDMVITGLVGGTVTLVGGPGGGGGANTAPNAVGGLGGTTAGVTGGGAGADAVDTAGGGGGGTGASGPFGGGGAGGPGRPSGTFSAQPASGYGAGGGGGGGLWNGTGGVGSGGNGGDGMPGFFSMEW